MSKPGWKSHPKQGKKGGKRKKELKVRPKVPFEIKNLTTLILVLRMGNEFLMEKVCKKPRF
jgi:hypothetical protein